MIPRIIHQTWTSRDIPKHLRGYQESWLHKHPDWEYRLWDDAANEALIAEHYPEFLDYYRRATPRIIRPCSPPATARWPLPPPACTSPPA